MDPGIMAIAAGTTIIAGLAKTHSPAIAAVIFFNVNPFLILRDIFNLVFLRFF